MDPRDGEDWEFFVAERSDRIRDHVPWDETDIPPSKVAYVALLRAEREARALGLRAPALGIKSTPADQED